MHVGRHSAEPWPPVINAPVVEALVITSVFGTALAFLVQNTLQKHTTYPYGRHLHYRADLGAAFAHFWAGRSSPPGPWLCPYHQRHAPDRTRLRPTKAPGSAKPENIKRCQENCSPDTMFDSLRVSDAVTSPDTLQPKRQGVEHVGKTFTGYCRTVSPVGKSQPGVYNLQVLKPLVPRDFIQLGRHHQTGIPSERTHSCITRSFHRRVANIH